MRNTEDNKKTDYNNDEVFKKAVFELNSKPEFTFDDLCTIVELLRSKNGCPWDREQTNKSVRNAIIDETYEFIEGLDNNDNKLMCEELGDVLLQIIFHSCIKAETDEFSIHDVIDGICKKMILRHPHVFSDIAVKDSDEVLVNWENIKNQEKSRKTPYQQLESVAFSLPALMRAQKLQSKAEKTGLSDKKVLLDYINDISCSLECIKSGNTSEQSFADLLFACVGAARVCGLSSEEALYRKNDEFLKSFK